MDRAHRSPRESPDIDLDDVVRRLTEEFDGRVAPVVVTDVVRDSYEQLRTHVPRTARSYLIPWARQRLIGRSTSGREPSLTAMLSMPTHRL
jgi:hypothetical protein